METTNNCFNCVTNTTAHGIPKIVGIKSKFWRTLWTLFTLISLATLTLHTSTLVGRYLEAPTSIDLLPKSKLFIAPDIHICNQLPLSPSYAALAESTPEDTNLDYVKSLASIAEGTLKMAEKEYYQTTINTFWDTIPFNIIYQRFGHQIQQTILNATNGNKFKPMDITSFEVIPDWNHFACIRYRPRQDELSLPEKKLTFYLYNDATHLTSPTSTFMGMLWAKEIPFKFRPQIGIPTGFAIYFTSPGERPSQDSTMVTANPGQMTTVKLRMKSYQMENKRDRPCVQEKPIITYKDPIFNGNITFNSSISDCVLQKWHQSLINKCKCHHHDVPKAIDVPDHIPLCNDVLNIIKKYDLENIASDMNDLYNKTYKLLNYNEACVDYAEYSYNDSEAIFRECQAKMPCEFLEYEVATTSSAWPNHQENARLLLKNYLKQDSETIWTPGLDELDNETLSRHMIKQNYLMLVVHTGEIRSTEIIESYSYHIQSLLSDVGGIMGFYLGVSALTFFEIFEICKGMCKRRQQIPTPLELT